MVGSVPPDKCCAVLDRELGREYWDENDGENFADGNDSHILLKCGGGHFQVLLGVKNSKMQYDPSPTVMHDRVRT